MPITVLVGLTAAISASVICIGMMYCSNLIWLELYQSLMGRSGKFLHERRNPPISSSMSTSGLGNVNANVFFVDLSSPHNTIIIVYSLRITYPSDNVVLQDRMTYNDYPPNIHGHCMVHPS